LKDSNIYAQLSAKRQQFIYRVAEFEKAYEEDADSKIGSTFKEMETAIKKALDLQHKAGFIFSICHSILLTYRSVLRSNRAGTEEYMGAKNSIDEMTSHYDYYRNHMYTLSQRAKTISELMKNKMSADPEVVHWARQ
jgi:hypothetical protein